MFELPVIGYSKSLFNLRTRNNCLEDIAALPALHWLLLTKFYFNKFDFGYLEDLDNLIINFMPERL